MKRIFLYVSYLLISTLILLVALEFSIRLLLPQINYQGNQGSMFAENRFHKTMGLVPNSSGEFFGKIIHTDKYGFRQMNAPVNYDKSWLFLGDSVTFGLGVNSDRIFPQLIQDKFRDTRIWNSAVPGYSTVDYRNVLDVFLLKHRDIEKVVLFFCLNDVYGNLSLNYQDASGMEKVLSFLRTNSKFFLFLKKVLFDRSKAYALHDIGLYDGQNSNLLQYLKVISSIKSKLDKLNIDFMVVVLPYEYQLRVRGLTSPQTLLSDFFAAHNIKSVDLFDDFMLSSSEEYYLYGDPMHFSVLGHETVAKKMVEVLK